MKEEKVVSKMQEMANTIISQIRVEIDSNKHAAEALIKAAMAYNQP